MDYIINVQGLRDLHNKFITIKEAVLSLKNRVIGHWIIKASHNYTGLPIGIKRSNEYIFNQFYGIPWHKDDFRVK